jgi:hypothetical protein
MSGRDRYQTPTAKMGMGYGLLEVTESEPVERRDFRPMS